MGRQAQWRSVLHRMHQNTSSIDDGLDDQCGKVNDLDYRDRLPIWINV